MLRMSLAPCAPFNVTTKMMIDAAELARRYPGVRLHTHLAENQVFYEHLASLSGIVIADTPAF